MGDHFMRYQVDTGADRGTVRDALVTKPGIEGWWTDTASVPEHVGGRLALTFPNMPQPFDLELAEASGERIVWLAGSFPPFWQGTSVHWELADNPDRDGTRIVMTHTGWDPHNPVVGMVTQGWGEILTHLRAYLQSGNPDPYFAN
jgi:Activator of Hsp90 ATPase homolog 1-like protein